MTKEIPVLLEPLQPIPERSFHNTLAFIENVSVPINSRPQNNYFPSKNGNQTLENWIKGLSITGLYLSNTSTSYSDLGKKYGLSRERIRSIYTRNIVRILFESNSEVQESFPLENLEFGKTEVSEKTKNALRELGRKRIIPKKRTSQTDTIPEDELNSIKTELNKFFMDHNDESR